MIKRISRKKKQELNEIFAQQVKKTLTERRLEDIKEALFSYLLS